MPEQEVAPGFWRKMYEKMLADMENPAFRRFGSYTIAGRSYTYRSLKDFMDLLDWVKNKADIEDGVAPYRARHHARNAGRGYAR